MENDFNPEELIAEIHKGRNFRSMISTDQAAHRPRDAFLE